MARNEKLLLTHLVLSTFFICHSLCQTVNVNCNTLTTLTKTGYTIVGKFPSTQMNTCEYVVRSVVDSYFVVEVFHDMTGSGTSCLSQYIAISPDGDPKYRTSVKYCGYRAPNNPLRFNTIGNEIRFYITTNDLRRTAQFTLRNYPVTIGNCSCSWNPSSRIAKGQAVASSSFTAHVALVAKNGGYDESFCGGTIISNSFILTAAHCVRYMEVNVGLSNVMVHVGRQNISTGLYQDTPYSETYSISQTIVHYLYNDQSALNQNDIALVKTSVPIRYSRGVGPACIPQSYSNYIVPSGTTLSAIGFGATEFGLDARYDVKSWNLQYTQMIVNTTLNEGCNKVERICTQGPIAGNGRGDTCQRDSGGGVYGYIGNLYQLMAITSEGGLCGMRTSFAVNTDVPFYLSWIKKYIGNEILCNKN